MRAVYRPPKAIKEVKLPIIRKGSNYESGLAAMLSALAMVGTGY